MGRLVALAFALALALPAQGMAQSLQQLQGAWTGAHGGTLVVQGNLFEYYEDGYRADAGQIKVQGWTATVVSTLRNARERWAYGFNQGWLILQDPAGNQWWYQPAQAQAQGGGGEKVWFEDRVDDFCIRYGC